MLRRSSRVGHLPWILGVAIGVAGCGSSTDATSPSDDAAPLDGDGLEDTLDAAVGDAPDTRDAADVGAVDADAGVSPPTITSFVATPASITAGESSTLSWSVSGGSLTIDGAPLTGTTMVVTPKVTTKYTLKATNASGSVSATASVSVTASSVPSKPIAFTAEKPFTVDSGTTNYVYVPKSYDTSHKTPITLFVWLHGCGGVSSGDIWTVSPGGAAQTWISLTVGGAEGKCWDMGKGPPLVLAAIADLKTHFNIAPKGVILGGYSSGGDLTYRTAFYNAGMFAGVLTENTSPFRDTGSTEAASLAAASWKFNAVHVAHLQDTTYPIAGVRTETDAMIAAGFPMKRIEVDGGHYDAPGAIENGHPVPGTSADIATYLFPLLKAGWTAP